MTDILSEVNQKVESFLTDLELDHVVWSEINFSNCIVGKI